MSLNAPPIAHDLPSFPRHIYGVVTLSGAKIPCADPMHAPPLSPLFTFANKFSLRWVNHLCSGVPGNFSATTESRPLMSAATTGTIFRTLCVFSSSKIWTKHEALSTGMLKIPTPPCILPPSTPAKSRILWWR